MGRVCCENSSSLKAVSVDCGGSSQLGGSSLLGGFFFLRKSEPAFAFFSI
jgi:hypothetical protein